MKLSLSARLIEVTKEKFALDVGEFLDLAKRTGYEGVHLRDGQIDPLLREGRFDEVEAFYKQNGLGCSMIWGRIDSRSFDRDLIEKKMAFLRRVDLNDLMIGYPTDMDLIRTWCDLAAAQGIGLVIACHVNSLFEDISRAMDFVKQVDRPNLGLNIDPLNIYLAEQDYGLKTLEKIKDHLRVVNVQGGVLDSEGDQVARRYYKETTPSFRRVPICEEDAMDIRQFISDLKAVGYQGYINVLEPYYEDRDLSRIASETARILKGYFED